MNDIRLWLPGQDAYHAAFRMLRIMLWGVDRTLELEKLYILDLFVAYPCLLHRTHMPMDMRRSFRALNIERPESFFLSLPSMASLFRDMELIQSTAVKSLVGKNIFNKDTYLKKQVSLNRNKIPQELKSRLENKNDEENDFMSFFLSGYGSRSLSDLKQSTNLERRIY